MVNSHYMSTNPGRGLGKSLLLGPDVVVLRDILVRALSQHMLLQPLLLGPSMKARKFRCD